MNNTMQKQITVFTIDYDYNDSMVQNIKQYYQVKEVPTLIIDNKIFPGRLYTKEQIEAELS
jgi:hypothetical protein